MSGRKLNALEQKIHQSALAANDKVRVLVVVCSATSDVTRPDVQKLSQKQVDALSTDTSARTAALNFLLGTGLLKVLKGEDGKLFFRGVVKEELDVKTESK